MKATQSAPPLSERDLNLLQPYLQKPISVATCFCLDVHLRFIPTSVPHSEDIYFFHSFPCKRAKVCGIVVGLIIGEARLVYMIDDGTAVLECVCWLRNKPREEEKGWIEANAFRVGQTVFIVGQIDSYKEERQLTVQSLSKHISYLPPCSVANKRRRRPRNTFGRRNQTYTRLYDTLAYDIHSSLQYRGNYEDNLFIAGSKQLNASTASGPKFLFDSTVVL